MRPNKIRSLLDSGSPTVGTHLFLSDPAVVETVGHSGRFDYVEFLAEYTQYSFPRLDDFCRAAELHNLGSMIKVDLASHRLVAQRAVGAGFESVLFADPRTADQVDHCVRSVRADVPGKQRGAYGAALRRNCPPGYGTPATLADDLAAVVVAIMIEKDTALDNVDTILQTPGIDMIQWGPTDYAMSIGAFDEARDSDRLCKLERGLIEKCHEAGVAFRAECSTLEAARYYLDLGVRHFCYGWDLMTLHERWRSDGERLRDLISDRTGIVAAQAEPSATLAPQAAAALKPA
jgi:2-keto-3-deoxy-L-rhamnonate aldolase RhmA